MHAKTITITNQKGIVGKTTTCLNLGVSLAAQGKKVLLIDSDPQGSLTVSLGHTNPDNLPVKLSDHLRNTIEEIDSDLSNGILYHPEGIDFVPANIELAGLEVSLFNVMNREKILKQYIDSIKTSYDYIPIDCMPSLGMLTINALAAADSVIIPVQAQYLSAKGLEQLLHTINKVKRQINPNLKIDGILLTMVDGRTNNAREISNLIRNTYGSNIKVFDTAIPHSVRAAESASIGKSIFTHDPYGKVAKAYTNLPSERAYAYKLKLEALKHQGLRTDLTSCHVGTKLRVDNSLAESVGESARTVQRYIRLTELTPDLLDLVDDKKKAFNPAVEISFLNDDEQRQLLEAMDMQQTSPSLSQAQRIKKFSQEGKLSIDVMTAIMSEEKRADLDKITLTGDRLKKYFPRNYTPQQMEETIIKLLEGWAKRRQHSQER